MDEQLITDINENENSDFFFTFRNGKSDIRGGESAWYNTVTSAHATTRLLRCAANYLRASSHVLTASKTPVIPDGSHFFRLLGCRSPLPLPNQQQHRVLVIFKYAWLPVVLFSPHDIHPHPPTLHGPAERADLVALARRWAGGGGR